jgi:hypothetical protein
VRYTRELFDDATGEERARLMAELAQHLTGRLRGTADYEAEIVAMIAELRELGHDLWSFDADDGFQIWCSSWVGARANRGIILDFRWGREVEVTVEWPDH